MEGEYPRFKSSYLHEELVAHFHREVAAEEALMQRVHDALVLDLGLPGRTGLEVLGAMRRRGDARPVLVLTARDAVADRVAGLDAGADDYLVKPFSARELLARVEASLILARVRGEFERRMAADLEAMTRLRASAASQPNRS